MGTEVDDAVGKRGHATRPLDMADDEHIGSEPAQSFRLRFAGPGHRLVPKRDSILARDDLVSPLGGPCQCVSETAVNGGGAA